MKKILSLILFVGLTFVLSSCGPNSDYYKTANQKTYYYNNMSLVMDPYTLVEDTETNDWIKGVSNEQFETFREDYRVEVEYRIQGSGDKYKNYQFTEDNEKYEIVVGSPVELFDGEEVNYEVKVHFINKNTEDLKEMINYYGIYNMVPSNINPIESVVTSNQYDEYNLLSNIEVTDLEADTELTDLYEFSYAITDDENNPVTIDITDGSLRFMTKGTYNVVITATEILGEGEVSDDTDDDAGASEPWTGQNATPNITFLSNTVTLATDEEVNNNLGDTLTISYSIVVE